MIKFSNQVPSIYPSASRDFQYVGWLADIVLNGVKHNVDSLYNLPIADNDVKLTELLAMTLGFKIKRNYDKKQLAALAAILPSILKYKGTEKAITMAAGALIKASGASGNLDCKVNGTQLQITLPEGLIDATLFTDLLEYILPAGMTCRVIRSTQTKYYLDPILVGAKDTVQFDQYEDVTWAENNLSTGLAMLYDATVPGTDFVANFLNSEEGTTLNAGLLSNTVIPVFSTTTPSDFTEEKIYPNMVDCEGKILIDTEDRVLFASEDTHENDSSSAEVSKYINMVDAEGKVLISSDYLILLGREGH